MAIVNQVSDRFLYHVVLEYTAFSKASTTSDPVLLFRAPPRCVFRNMRIRHRIPFTGGAITAYTVSIGTAALPEKYASRYDIYQAAANTTFELVQQLASESCGDYTSVYATAYCVGADLDKATAGNVQFSMEMIIL